MAKLLKIIEVLVTILYSNFIYGQDIKTSRSSLKSGIGLGVMKTENEFGLGAMFFLGYQHSFMQDKIRLSPNVTLGAFAPFFIADEPSFQTVALGLNGYLDIFKSSSASLFLGTGLFANYLTRERNGGESWPSNNSPKTIHKFYFGGLGALGFRLGSPAHRLNLEFNPINIHYGTDYFLLGYTSHQINSLVW